MSQNYNNMTVAELKEILKDKGLSTIGKKAELVERINQANENDLLQDTDTTVLAANVDEDKILGDESSITDASDVKEEAPSTNGSSESVTSPAAEKSTKSESEDKSKSRAARFGLPITGPTTNADAKAARAARFGLPTAPSAASIEEAKAARAKRFGLENVSTSASRPAIDDAHKAKLIERAARFGIPVSADGKRVSTAKPGVDLEKLEQRAKRFGISTDSAEVELKKKARAERFGLA